MLDLFVALALEAGEAIMDVYRRPLEIERKPDGSPVTEADRAAEDIIAAGLARAFPDITCVAEEASSAGVVPPPSREFFLVDPLDGTREFVARNPDFTVNIALVRDGVPVVGVVHAPARGSLHGGRPGEAFRMVAGAETTREPIAVSPSAMPLRVLASRSHRDTATDDFLARMPGAEVTSIGSSLKFCLIAEGAADLYPRFGPTMEWDTAAGDAVLRAAGGMTVTKGGDPLAYGKRARAEKADFLNPAFIAYGAEPPDNIG